MKFKLLYIAIATLLGLSLLPPMAMAEAKDLAVDEIIKRANHMSLYQGKDGKGTVTLFIKDSQGRVRKRQFNMLRKNQDVRDENQKYYTYFQSPADVRKMAFIVHKHAAVEKDDDRWLYLPSLDLVKRIAAGDKRTSFVGSDFLYEDISGRSPLEDKHQITRVNDTFYVVKNTPKLPDSVEFAYYVAYIDKKTFIPMKIDFYKDGDKLYRVIEVLKIKNVLAREDGKDVIYPTVVSSRARNLETGSTTEMNFSNIKYNIGLSDSIFTERFLRRPPREAMR